MAPGATASRPAPRVFWVWAAVWLFYMAGPIADAWQRPQLWQRLLGLAAGIGFCGLYLFSFMVARKEMRRTGAMLGLRRSVARLAAMVALTATLAAVVGESGLTALVYVAVMAVFTLPV